MTLDNIKEEIEKANSIVLLTHENPDGDAIGSTLAFYLALKQLGKEVDIIIPKFSRTFAFLPGAEKIMKEGTKTQYDLAIALDSADLKRLNGWVNYFEDAKVTVSIDHRGSNQMYADFNFVNPAAPACAQILVTVLEFLQVEITKDIGTCILTGIITDTGGFKYPGVTAETFEFASWLLGIGVNVSEIYKKVLQVKTKSNFELSKIAMDRLEFLEDGKIAYTYITNEDLEKVNAETGDHEGLVEIGRDVEGVEVSIFLREEEKGIKASLRSNDYLNVSDVCIAFGGGGHPRAAGCTIIGTMEHAKQKIISQIKQNLK